jgi:hypothetical protein
MSARCNGVDRGCEGTCSTECFKCGNAACAACSSVIDYMRYGQKRICRACQDEIKEDDARAEKARAEREERARLGREYLAANPGAPARLAALRKKAAAAKSVRDEQQRLADAAGRRYDGLRKEIADLAGRLGQEIPKEAA